ncbi:Rid family detoxifying hydrolase [Chitinispirillales bacterium ANBcel5]|uniref:Rid family detoxifying hydrolase n=1 Tax=Cellulosispirillum alkaliphilum TaxID=3039283 RepID=UPI002A581CED|nr:Rid family detoxifying hydrolase [Chitinispirillales bacterium ANBcel5]
MNSRLIRTDKAPLPVGPYSQAVSCGDFLFISGQIALDPHSGTICGTTTEEQTRCVMHNLRAILHSQGLKVTSLVKTTVFLKDMADFPSFNSVYEKELQGAKPARSVVEVSSLPMDGRVKIEAVACR